MDQLLLFSAISLARKLNVSYGNTYIRRRDTNRLDFLQSLARLLYPIWGPRGLFVCLRSPPPRTPIRLGSVPLKVGRNLVGETVPRAWLVGRVTPGKA
jgi:hypothetical protein